ncbi:endonuclease III domain-containing protein [Aurantiacibacter poecillastricola]|uniref:endonuclease III domain-containing protein n=1 Tax=Aurantiacibacter poecillastricola TaxID=3064385 RepID=UPI00273E4CB7|nr:endonuclease III [Aurantiacibacter sp. 219JJ12-13]MDP5260802.1 endonuclease III [Aurantiacibacter sp. 219JJ12-13]
MDGKLPFGPDPRTDQLARIHAALIRAFGRIERPDEKRRDPVWTLVQGVIGAQTKTAISNASTDGVLARFESWEAVAGAELDDLQQVLANQTFPSVAAERLKACLSAIIAERGAVDLRHLSNLPDEQAMAWLEALPGVGRKIAAGVMNTSIFARRQLVIDGHHRRVMQRTGLVPPRADTARAYTALMPLLPEEWSAADIDEHHLLVKRLGQVHCRPARPHCAVCPIHPDCETGTAIEPVR